MKTEDPLSEADEQSSEAFRNFPYDQVDAHLAASPVPPWREALAEAVDALTPGGSLHIVDFGDCAGLPAPFRAALGRWLALFDVTPRVNLRAELAALAAARGVRCETPAV